MKRHHSWLTALLIPAFLVACESNPTTPADDGDDHDDSLNAELTLSSDHIHILSELTFTVTVTDHHGEVVTDLAQVMVERKAAGSDTWRNTELALSGTAYEGAYTFTSSGDYDLRVAVVRTEGTDPEVIYTMPEPVSAARAHAEVDGIRVEFESFPGHIHAGETAEMRFWIMEPERDAAGNRAPMPGLHVVIACMEENGTSEEHHATEVEPGVYMAQHTFGDHSAGEFLASIHVGEHGGHVSEAEFMTHVASTH